MGQIRRSNFVEVKFRVDFEIRPSLLFTPKIYSITNLNKAIFSEDLNLFKAEQNCKILTVTLNLQEGKLNGDVL